MNSNVYERKVVLLTKESGNDHYWDTTFSLRPTFRGNNCGQYKVTVNEALFNNTEPLICKGDYYEFNITTTTGYKFKWRVNVKKDFYLYRQGTNEWQSVISLLVGTLGTQIAAYNYTYCETVRTRYNLDNTSYVYPATDTSFNMAVSLKNDDGTPFNGTARGVNPIMYYELDNIQLGTGYGNVASVTMTYSWGFVYILNNRASTINPVTDNNLKPVGYKAGAQYFEFCNIRIGGPYFYVLDMPTLKTDVMTMNEANQSYNVVGLVKNTADNHNENIQFISSMQGKVNSLANFRVRLLNDNFEPIKIRSPLYVQVTISNEDE